MNEAADTRGGHTEMTLTAEDGIARRAAATARFALVSAVLAKAPTSLRKELDKLSVPMQTGYALRIADDEKLFARTLSLARTMGLA